MMDANHWTVLECERRYLERLSRKSGNLGCPLLRSLLVLTLMAMAVHAVEQSGLPGWLSFTILYLPVLALLGHFRRRGVFKLRLMLKLAVRCGLVGQAGSKPDTGVIVGVVTERGQ